MNVDCFCFTVIGGRRINEDALGYRQLANGWVFALADGLGGHHKGEEASQCAVNTLLEAKEPEIDEKLPHWMEAQMEKANQKILALQASSHSNMKSTLVSLVLRDDLACFANVGDSRLYYFCGGALHSFTEDHSVAYKKYLAGQISRNQIGSDEDQSSLLKVLGTEGRCQPAIYKEIRISSGDAFLLCSDGFWEYVQDEEMMIDYYKALSAKGWAELLLLRLMDRVEENHDNLSVIAVKIL